MKPDATYTLESTGDSEAEIGFAAFDTTIRIRAYGDAARIEGALLEAFEACQLYERLFSRTLSHSDVWHINESHGEWVDVDPRTYELVEAALAYCAASHGVFDVTIGALSRLWDFKRGVMPCPDALESALSHVDWRAIELSREGDDALVRLKDPQASIDLGGIAKGWIADALRALLFDHGVEAFVIDLGGNILVEGDKPGGEPWVVRLPDPARRSNARSEATPSASITLRRGSVVTSGVYERAFEQDGMLLHHVLDPKTGMPVQIEHPAATVVCERSIDAEGFSTTMLALGLEKSRTLAAEHPEILQAYFISWDGTPQALIA